MENRTVLFVDDDEIVLKSIEKSIMDEPYDKYFAKSGKDALESNRMCIVIISKSVICCFSRHQDT